MKGRLLYFFVGADLALTPRHLPHSRARWQRRADDDVWEAAERGTEAVRQEILMISRLRAS